MSVDYFKRFRLLTFQPGYTLKVLLSALLSICIKVSCAQDTLLNTARDSTNTPTDMVQMQNNDRLTGEIIKVQRGQLYFDGDITDEVTIDLKDIKSLKGQMHIYRIEIINKGLYIGKIAYASQDGYFLIVRANDSLLFPITDIAWLRSYTDVFLQRVEGSLYIGYTYTRAGGFDPVNISNQLLYTRGKGQVYQGFSGIYPATDGNGFERIDAHMGLRYLLNSRWIALTHLQYQRIVELGLKARMLNMTGAVRRLIENRHILLDAGTGIAVQKEYARDGGISRLQAEWPAIFDFSLFQLGKPDLDIIASVHLFYNLSEANRFRMDYTVTVSYEIVTDFTIGMQFYYNYDSKPFLHSTTHSDFGNVLTLGYTF